MPTATATRTEMFTGLSSGRRLDLEHPELVIESFNYWNDRADVSQVMFCLCFTGDDDAAV